MAAMRLRADRGRLAVGPIRMTMRIDMAAKVAFEKNTTLILRVTLVPIHRIDQVGQSDKQHKEDQG